jgi:hypothetical protein
MRPKRERGIGRNPGSLFLAFFDAFEYNGDAKIVEGDLKFLC